MEEVPEEVNPDEHVLAALGATGVPWQRIDIDPALADTAAFCEHYGYSLDISANTIVVASKRGERTYSASVVLATTRLDVNRMVRKLMGVSKVSFASAEDTKQLTGMEIGGVTPFGLPPGVPLYVDSAVMRCDEIILGGGSRSWKVLSSPEILAALPGFREVAGLAAPIPV